MAFDTLETSLADGQPLRCYAFTRGAAVWAYTTHTAAVPYGGIVYDSVGGISDDGIRQTGQATADALTVTVPASVPLVALWRTGARPGGTVEITIHDLHWTEGPGTDDAGGVVGMVAWVGQVTDVTWAAQDRCEITCQSLSALLDREGRRLTYQRECPHCLYDRNCTVDPADHATPAEIAAIDGPALTVTGLETVAAGWFKGGFLAWTTGDGFAEARGIDAHAVDPTGTDEGGNAAPAVTLTLIGGTAGLTAGQLVTVHPGCPGTFAACAEKFDNSLNYGGCRDMPGVSPFQGTPVF